MEEKEIIQYLKDNMKKGISFWFMPEEVQNWIKKNYRNCAYLTAEGIWDTATHHVSNINEIWANEVYALIAAYKPKMKEPELENGWFVYEIDKNGNFYSADADDEDGCYYHWSEWNTCLANNKDNLVAFGGWQYEENGDWHTSPQLSLVDDTKREFHLGRYTDGKAAERVKPLIPIKIRFWREKQ